MRLWTIQHEDVLRIVREKGVFRADGRRCDRDFREAYAWLRQEVRKRVPGATGRPLIWAWKQPKPDLRQSGHLHEGTPGVRIELEIPDERVLLSDFDGWHFRLSSSYLPISAADMERWHEQDRKKLQALQKENPRITTAELNRRIDEDVVDVIEGSWDRVFDLPLMQTAFCDDGMVSKDYEQHIQAVFEYFTTDEIRKVTRFIAR
jgi:hypothetical protein